MFLIFDFGFGFGFGFVEFILENSEKFGLYITLLLFVYVVSNSFRILF